jgi:uncharacterized protein (DUF4415 family)
MKPRKRVTKRKKASRKKYPVKITRIEASAQRGMLPQFSPEELAGLYRPLKKPITLRLDADILEWFQRGGRGYQTRINQALRKLMMEERKKARG